MIQYSCVVSISELLEHQIFPLAVYTKTIIVYVGMLATLACLDVEGSLGNTSKLHVHVITAP